MSTLRVGSVRNPAGTGFSSLSVPSMVRVSTSNGNGSTNTVIRRFTTIETNQGTDITYADSATLGGSFTVNADGVYSVSYSDSSNAAFNMGVSVNSANLTTNIGSIPASERLAIAQTNAANSYSSVSWTGFLASGAVIRAHNGAGAGNGSPNVSTFTIARVS